MLRKIGAVAGLIHLGVSTVFYIVLIGTNAFTESLDIYHRIKINILVGIPVALSWPIIPLSILKNKFT